MQAWGQVVLQCVHLGAHLARLAHVDSQVCVASTT
jgi:hypothetical protein